MQYKSTEITYVLSFYSEKYKFQSWLQPSSILLQQFVQFIIKLFKGGKFIIIILIGRKIFFKTFRNPFFLSITSRRWTSNNLMGNKHWKLSVVEFHAIGVLFLDASFNNVCICTYSWNVQVSRIRLKSFVLKTLKNTKKKYIFQQKIFKTKSLKVLTF